MFGKDSRVNPLESRKQLLIAESELNRAQLAGDLAELKGRLHAFTENAKALSSIASSTAALIAGLVNFRRNKPVEADAKPSWMQTALKGAGLVSSLWTALRSRGAAHENEPPDMGV